MGRQDKHMQLASNSRLELMAKLACMLDCSPPSFQVFLIKAHVMSRDYCDTATELQKRTVKVNCRRELKN